MARLGKLWEFLSQLLQGKSLNFFLPKRKVTCARAGPKEGYGVDARCNLPAKLR